MMIHRQKHGSRHDGAKRNSKPPDERNLPVRLTSFMYVLVPACGFKVHWGKTFYSEGMSLFRLYQLISDISTLFFQKMYVFTYL